MSSGNYPIRPEQIKESRVNQQFNYLLNSQQGNNELNKLRDENSRMAEENRRLTILLKDGNKVDLNMVKRESDALRRDNDSLRR